MARFNHAVPPPLSVRHRGSGVAAMKNNRFFPLFQPTSSRSANRTARHGFGNSSGLVGMNLLA